MEVRESGQGEQGKGAGEGTGCFPNSPIKDLKLGARLAAEITDNKTWREEQPAQFTVARDEIVSAIQARLSGS